MKACCLTRPSKSPLCDPVILSMARRETRGAWRHFLYFFVCIAVGVGALVGVSLFAVHVDRAVTKEARGLLGGDLEIRSSHPLIRGPRRPTFPGSAGNRRDPRQRIGGDGRQNRTQTAAGQITQIVELKAVEPAYPFYGTLKLEPVQPLDRLLHPDASMCETAPCHGAVVQEALLLRMGLAIGDRVKIGQAEFLVTGLVRIEPDRTASAFSLGPRIILSQEEPQTAALIKPGSRVRERQL